MAALLGSRRLTFGSTWPSIIGDNRGSENPPRRVGRTLTRAAENSTSHQSSSADREAAGLGSPAGPRFAKTARSPRRQSTGAPAIPAARSAFLSNGGDRYGSL